MLTKDEKRLAIFANGITVDNTLPKYTRVKEEMEKKSSANGNDDLLESSPFMDTELVDIARGETFEQFRDMDTHSINVYLSEKDYKHFMNGGRYSLLSTTNNSFVNVPANSQSVIISNSVNGLKDKKSIFKRLFGKGKEEIPDEEIDKYELDIVQFFREIKKCAKIHKDDYANRVEGYITALKTADMAGQEAFKERLLRDLVINKYESILYATENYYVVDEKTAVEFAKKSEKGVNLVYAKNYLRPIPIEVVNKIKEMNELEIFDNYVIMHYDPENKYSEKTHSEKVKEEEKKRDPILFGVISGSNKLYYITDWEDEYCNLTLDEFVNVLQIEKNKLKISKNVEF